MIFSLQASITDKIALYGESKYTSKFSHFDYVNQNAPQGGKIVLPAYGTFDNFKNLNSIHTFHLSLRASQVAQW